MTAPLRTIVVGLEHYHVTGWVETLVLFPEQVEIVARYDPDPARANAVRPRFIDPNLPDRFPDSFRATPFSPDLARLIEIAVVDERWRCGGAGDRPVLRGEAMARGNVILEPQRARGQAG